jgi:hypothetical protein
MFAAIRRYPTPSPKTLIRQVKREFVPVISKVEGLVAYYVMDTGNEVLAVSVFETRDAAACANDRAAAWMSQNSSAQPAVAAEVVSWS